MLAGFFASKLLGPLASGAAAILLGVCIYLWISTGATIKQLEKQNTSLQTKLDQCERDKMQLQANQGRLEASISSQNASIANLQATAAQRDAAGAADRETARRQVESAQAKAARLAAARPGADACASANDLILESLQ